MGEGVSVTILRPPTPHAARYADEAQAFTSEGLIPVVLSERVTRNEDLQVAFCMGLCLLCLPCTAAQILFGKQCFGCLAHLLDPHAARGRDPTMVR